MGGWPPIQPIVIVLKTLSSLTGFKFPFFNFVEQPFSAALSSAAPLLSSSGGGIPRVRRSVGVDAHLHDALVREAGPVSPTSNLQPTDKS